MMTSSKTLGASVLALSMFTTAGWSLTAEEAWQNWQDQAALSGKQTLTNTGTAKSGDTLTVSGLAFSMSIDEVTTTGELGDVTFTENSDGTVTIQVPESYDMNFLVKPEFGEVVDVTLNINQSGLSLIASDAGGASTFSYSAPSLEISVTKVLVDGEDLPMQADVKLGATNGSYTMSPTSPPEVTQLFSAASADLTVKVKEPDGPGAFNMSVSSANLSSTSKGAGALYFGGEDLPKLLKDGLSTAGSFVYGSTVFDMDFQDDSDSFAAKGAMNGGTLAVTMDKDQLTYNVTNNGMNVSASGSEIPLPEVSFGLGSSAYTLVMPLGQSNEPKPFVLSMAMNELSLIDGIWNLFDPGAVLPREPATVTLDLSGQANWLIDIFDEDAFLATDIPAQIHALSISNLLVDVVGTQLTGEGSFTFDNNDLATFGGMPAPNGSMNIKLVGANALLDKLVTMGFVTSDDAATAKLMSGMVLRPGEGEDTLVSEFGVTPDGNVTANGIPLPF